MSVRRHRYRLNIMLPYIWRSQREILHLTLLGRFRIQRRSISYIMAGQYKHSVSMLFGASKFVVNDELRLE